MTDSASPLVQFDREPPLVTLTLNNPARRNTLSRETLSQLHARLGEIDADAEILCAILRAEGTVYCSGHDLNEIIDLPRAELESLFSLCTRVMDGIRRLRCPVIAEVQGLATAAGCQLAASCDLVVAAATATFATPGVKLGFFCTTPGVALARVASPKRALEMLLTGEAVSAEAAREIGLVNRVVPPERLAAETRGLAMKIAAHAGPVVALGKRAFYEQLSLDQADAYELAERVMVDNACMSLARTGIGAFLKRPAAE